MYIHDMKCMYVHCYGSTDDSSQDVGIYVSNGKYYSARSAALRHDQIEFWRLRGFN
jgi:hypothetical protein